MVPSWGGGGPGGFTAPGVAQNANVIEVSTPTPIRIDCYPGAIPGSSPPWFPAFEVPLSGYYNVSVGIRSTQIGSSASVGVIYRIRFVVSGKQKTFCIDYLQATSDGEMVKTFRVASQKVLVDLTGTYDVTSGTTGTTTALVTIGVVATR